MLPPFLRALHSDFVALLEHLDKHQEISLRTTVDNHFRKSLLLSAASYFETSVTDCVTFYVEEVGGGNPLLKSFVKNKAISRQYHTYFDWNSKNANSFFAMFGEGFKAYMKERLVDEPALQTSIAAFLEVGADRNRLVHQNFGMFSLEKTSEEIFSACEIADLFVEKLPELLRACPVETRSRPNLGDEQVHEGRA